jgi:chaperone required for assembly of F1-ATPase
MDFVKSQEYIAAHRDETIAEMCRFLLTDTLLFWSDNPDLFVHQQKHWQPIIDELNDVFKLKIQTTTDIIVPENKVAEIQFSQQLNRLSDKELTGCFLTATELKSVLLGFLLIKHKITAEKAFNSAFLEELYQNQFWGEDFAVAHQRENIQKRLQQITEYLK